MDNFETIVQVVLVIIFVFGQFLFRLFVKGVKGKAATKPAVPNASPAPEEWTEPEDELDWKEAEKKPASRLAKPIAKADSIADTLRKSVTTVLQGLDLQQHRVKTMVTTAEYRNYHALSRELSLYMNRTQKIIEQFENTRDLKEMTRSVVDHYKEALDILDARLTFFEGVLSERTASYAKQHNAADLVTEALCFRYRHGHPNSDTYFKNMVGLAVSEENVSGGGLYAIATPMTSIKSPGAWAGISFSLAKTVIDQSRMATKTAAELGLPSALTSMSYFLSSGRLMSSGLISAWISWLMADVAATLQMGIAYGWVLLKKCESPDEATVLDTFSITKKGSVSGMPLLARIVTVHTILAQMDVFDLKPFSERVATLISLEDSIHIEIPGNRKIPLPLNSFRSDLESVAAALMDTPLSMLGHFTFDEMVGSDFSQAKQTVINEAADRLRKGHPVYECTPVELAMAASLALQKERNAERRIESAALHSLSETKQRHERKRLLSATAATGHGCPTRLKHVFSCKHLPNTIMVGALARGRAGLNPRR